MPCRDTFHSPCLDEPGASTDFFEAVPKHVPACSRASSSPWRKAFQHDLPTIRLEHPLYPLKMNNAFDCISLPNVGDIYSTHQHRWGSNPDSKCLVVVAAMTSILPKCPDGAFLILVVAVSWGPKLDPVLARSETVESEEGETPWMFFQPRIAGSLNPPL